MYLFKEVQELYKNKNKSNQTKCLELYMIISFTILLTIADVNEIVMKALILAGGRGKGTFSSGLKGGVHLTKK